MTHPEYAAQRSPGTWQVHVWVQPGARRNEVAGPHQGCLKLKLAAPAVDGKANKALVRFVAELFGVKVRGVRIVSGETSRRKIVEFESDSEPVWTPTGDEETL